MSRRLQRCGRQLSSIRNKGKTRNKRDHDFIQGKKRKQQQIGTPRNNVNKLEYNTRENQTRSIAEYVRHKGF